MNFGISSLNYLDIYIKNNLRAYNYTFIDMMCLWLDQKKCPASLWITKQGR